MSRRQRESLAQPPAHAPDEIDDKEWDLDEGDVDDDHQEEDAPSELESEVESGDEELREAVNEYRATAARMMNEEATRGVHEDDNE